MQCQLERRSDRPNATRLLRARNDLNGPFELLVVKSCAKVRVPVDHGLERVGQLRLVQWPGEVEACSERVDVCGSVTDRMEQETFL